MKIFQIISKVALFIVLLTFTSHITAQNNINMDVSSEGNLMWKNTNTLPDAEGSPFINETYLPIKVSVIPDKVYTGRFNAYNGEMEVDLGNGKIIALDISSEIEVTFIGSGDTYRVYDYMDANNNRQRRFLMVVHGEDKFQLLKEEKIKYIEGRQAQTSYDKDVAPKFKRSDDNYYINLNGTITYVPNKNKKVLSAFPKDAKALKGFMKKNKLNAKNEEDLVKIAEFLAGQ